jgi:hypothetical protein
MNRAGAAGCSGGFGVFIGVPRTVVSNFWEYTLVGIIVGLVAGWALSLFSGNIFVVFLVGSMGTVVGVVLGIVHRNNR